MTENSRLLNAAQAIVKSSGLTQNQFAESIGMDRQRISELMKKNNLRGTLIIEQIFMGYHKREFLKFLEAISKS